MSMSQFFSIIAGTPPWVWVLLAYLIFIGVRNSKTNIIYLPKLFIIPAIFLAMQYETVFSQQALFFVLPIIVSTCFSFLLYTKTQVEILKDLKSIKIGGSWSILIILLTFFFIKYFFGYIENTAPELAARYGLLNIIINGILSGYFIGRALCYLRKYLNA